MIDTVRFTVRTTTPYEQLAKMGVHRMGIDHRSDKIIFDNANLKMNLGSYNRDIVILADSLYPDSFVVQYSVPKLLYGNNVFLSDFADLHTSACFVYDYLCKLGVVVAAVDEWKITRLDLCYAWRFTDNDEARVMVDYLKRFRYSRKQTAIYDTSIHFVGSSYSAKFYLKQPEFLVHDFPVIRDNDRDDAYRLLGVSEGVLRFEVTCRKKNLTYNLGIDNIDISDILSNSSQLLGVMKKYFYKIFLNQVPKISNTAEVLNTLLRYTKPEIAKGAFYYYLAFTSKDEADLAIFKKLHSKRAIVRYRDLIKKAKIGLIKGITEKFDFDIPSNNCVGFFNNQDLSACVVTQADRCHHDTYA